MEIPIDVKVLCTDGEGGHTVAIIVDPATRQVTHVVVKGKGMLMGEFLVPVDAIDTSTAHELTLKWTCAELAAATRFDKAILVGDGGAGPGAAMMWPYAGVDDMNFGAPMPAAFVQVEEVPGSGVAIHVGAHVNATDGRVGKVDEFLIDRKTSVITHVILRQGHLWGKHDISVPISDIDHVEDDIVYLKIDKSAIEALPILPKQA